MFRFCFIRTNTSITFERKIPVQNFALLLEITEEKFLPLPGVKNNRNFINVIKSI